VLTTPRVARRARVDRASRVARRASRCKRFERSMRARARARRAVPWRRDAIADARRHRARERVTSDGDASADDTRGRARRRARARGRTRYEINPTARRRRDGVADVARGARGAEDANRRPRRDMRALAAYERRLDDVERRFAALRARVELALPSGLTTNARRAVRAAFAAARMRAEKDAAVASKAATPRRRRLGSKEGQRALRLWILEHFEHPFPTREEKRRLAREIGWSEFSVGNFFINARARFFKPLVMALAAELERDGVDAIDAGDDARV